MTNILMLLAGLALAQDTNTTSGSATRGERTADEESDAADAPEEGADEEGADEEEGAEDADEGGASDEPPPEVEPGSERVVYVVKEGDTVDSIAMNQGFLPDDIRRWNDLEGEPEPGDELILWAAPMEPEPEPEPEPEEEEEEPKGKAKKDKGGDGDGREGVAFFAGVQVGPAFSLNPLKTTVAPRLELGLELPPLDRSFRIFVSGQYLRPLAEGTVKDDRVPEGSFSYEVNQDELSIAFGPAFRFGMIDGPVHPEIAVGPNIFMYRSTANGSAGGSKFPESQEQYTRVGIYASGGIAADLGPGELTAGLMFQSSAFNATITGVAPSQNLSPMIGYRFVF